MILSTEVGPEMVGLVEVAREAVAATFTSTASPRVERPYYSSNPKTVCVSIRRGGSLRGCRRATGSSLEDATRDAALGAAADPRFPPLVYGELSACTFEVWILLESEPIVEIDWEILAGICGLELVTPSHRSFFLPSVPILSGFTEKEHLLARLRRKAGVSDVTVPAVGEELVKTSWRHLVSDASGTVVELRQCRPVSLLDLERRDAFAAAVAAGRHLVRLQSSSGAFSYDYDPLLDVLANKESFSVRVVGAAYSLGRLAAYLSKNKSDPDSLEQFTTCLIQASQRSFSHSFEEWRRLECFGVVTARAKMGRRLGILALMLLAAQQQGVSEEPNEVRHQLVERILATQSSEGWFPADLNYPQVPGPQEFYPGESLFALAGELPNDSGKIARAFSRAFGFYQAFFRSRPTTHFASWQAKAWCKAYESWPRNEFAEIAFELLDWLAMFQLQKSTAPVIRGGFVHSGASRGALPTFLSSIYAEAFLAGARVARLTGMRQREVKYLGIAKEGLNFSLRLQIRKEMAYLFPFPALAVGGFTKSLASFHVRCDYTLHALSMLVASLETDELWSESAR